jgi:hypothetical protein
MVLKEVTLRLRICCKWATRELCDAASADERASIARRTGGTEAI